MVEQLIVFGVIAIALVLFATSFWRYEIVALLSLLILVLTGIVSGTEAFYGFGHPAVITVAGVLVISRGLYNSGLVDIFARSLSSLKLGISGQLLVLVGLVALFSGFMNNVGALALFLPVALRMARRNSAPVSLYLMPIAFGSLLGGLMTLIGTPPNIIIALYRAEVGLDPFKMFDFTPVGFGVAVLGVLFISVIGWRLLPVRKNQGEGDEIFAIEEYITEVLVPYGSKSEGKTIKEIIEASNAEILVAGLVRRKQKYPVPSIYEVVTGGDILIVEADPENLQDLVESGGLELAATHRGGRDLLGSEEVALVEAVVTTDSSLLGKTARDMNLRWRYGINLLGVARQGTRLWERLGSIKFRAGDVLLLQGRQGTFSESLPQLGCLPLAPRFLRLGQPRRIFLALIILVSAVLAASFNLVPIQIALVSAALAMVVTGIISLRQAYRSIELPIIILLGAMIPVGEALEVTGGAELIGRGLLFISQQLPPAGAMVVVMVVTVCLSNIINNAAAAVLVAPIALSMALNLGVNPDPFLIGVAIAASSSFLTPIGHQSNILVMGPGGYLFGDYWKLGLPLTIIVLLAAVPLIMFFWFAG